MLSQIGSYMIPIATLLLLVVTPLRSQDIDYKSLAQTKIGKDKPGLILRDLGKAGWEIIAVGSATIETRERLSNAQIYREALLMAGAQARRAMAEFIGGTRVRGFEAAAKESRVLVDGWRKQGTMEKFSEFFKSQQQQDVHAFLRGTRQVAEWTSTDGTQALLAIAVCPEDIRQSLEISQTIAGIPSGERIKIVATEGTDMAPRRVQVWGSAAKTTDSIAATRRAAIYDALQLAVESAAGMTLGGRTSVRNLERVKSNISTMTTGFVKTFMVLTEEDHGNQFRVLVEAEVRPSLEGNLDLILSLLGSPKALLYGAGTPSRSSLTQQSGYEWIFEGIKGELQKAAIPLSKTQFDRIEKASHPATPNIPELLAEARKAQASILIVAVGVSVQAFCVATGDSVGERVNVVYDNHVWDFWKIDTRQVPVLANAIIRFWEDEVFNGTHIRCEIANMSSSYRQASILRKLIEELDGVKAVTQTSMDSQTRTAVLHVRFAGTAHDFLDVLMEAAENSMDENLKKLDVSKQEGNVIYLHF